MILQDLATDQAAHHALILALPSQLRSNPTEFPQSGKSSTYWKIKYNNSYWPLESFAHLRAQWAAPIICVQKKDKTLQMYIDYRRLNAVTKDDLYPLPRIDSGAAHISTIDLAKGYYQIPVAPEDQEKTAFVTPTGKYKFLKMPFGLKGAPSTFQRTMAELLRPHKPYSSSFFDDNCYLQSHMECPHLSSPSSAHSTEVIQDLQQS